MSLIQWYVDAVKRADADEHIDRSMLRVLVLVMVGLFVAILTVVALIALIVWKWWIGVPATLYIIYRAVRWAITEPEKEQGT